MSRVLVAMSGGVDSSVAAALLVRRDYDVIGVSLSQWADDGLSDADQEKGCGAPRALSDAERVCRILGVRHYVLDLRSEFQAAVINPWLQAYLHGETPNPCVACNRAVRFGTFLARADALGAELIATGHYARIVRDPATGRFRLLRGRDQAKDQSYVLHRLSQRQLARTLFPLGDLTKTVVRGIAAELGLPVAGKRESQEICFVPDDDYVGFVRRHGSSGPGAIEDTAGAVLGTHDGIEGFTVGQRRGLGLGGGGGRRYVVRIEPARNAVVVGGRTDACANRVRVRDVQWVAGSPPSGALTVDVKTRYRMPPEPAWLEYEARRGATLAFERPTWAPAAGQSAVFYRGDEVLGGGTIGEVWAA